MSKEWSASDVSVGIPIRSNVLEFQDKNGEWQSFHVIATPGRVVFGGACNAGFIESGYIEREEGESLDETLAEMCAELETYYNEGAEYTSRIVYNERM